MGLLWSGYLSADGFDVELITHKPALTKPFCSVTIQQLNTTLILGTADIDISATHKICSPIKVTSSLKPNNNSSAIRLLLVAVKAHQVVTAVTSILDRITAETSIILLQNGMGADNELIEAIPCIHPEQIINAVITHGAMKVDDKTTINSQYTHEYQVLHTGLGKTWLGQRNPLDSKRQQQLKKFIQSTLCTDWKDEIEPVLWQKLLINSVINPLTAILNCRNGDLLLPNAKPMLLKLLQESITIASKSGQHFILTEEAARLYEVIMKTASNYSSMHQDIKYNRVTEISYINGFLVKQAHLLGVDCPMNEMLSQIMMCKTQS